MSKASDEASALVKTDKTANIAKQQRITGKVRTAIDAMVWSGLPRKQAAEKAGISEHGLYKALRTAPVKAHYLRELDVLRTSERARNIHRLVDMRDQDENKNAVVNAIKALEQIDGVNAVNSGVSQSPGVVIVIQQAAPLIQHQTHSDAKPLITLDSVYDAE